MRLKLFEPDKETRAFIYQQIQELSLVLPDATSMVVLTREFVSKKRPQFFVEMVMQVQDQTVRIGARAQNLFDALVKARQQMTEVLTGLRNILESTPERDQKIQTMLNFSGAIH